MKERPILFNAEMVRAILDGRKTQTRRVIKLDHERGFKNPVVRGRSGEVSSVDSGLAHMLCPLGQPGDQLWVRETFMDLTGTGLEARTGRFEGFAYRADTPAGTYGDEVRKEYGLKWTPSLHMPRRASRITLEITSVGVQRLQDISSGDAVREGICQLPASGRYCINPGDQYFGGASHSAKEVYSWLWKSIYGEESWQANPWVWAIEFQRIKPGAK